MKKSAMVLFCLNSLCVLADDDSVDIKLESTFVGDKEQPTVSYFIPWQGIGTPDKLQWNISSKYDETLNLVDKNVLTRSTQIYRDMKLESTINPDN
ncbi:MAG: hypothetical protein AAGB12_08300 [Pseudomonadota bacterium]